MTTQTIRRMPLRALAATAATASVFALAGCGDDDNDDDAAAAPTQRSTPSAAGSSSAATDGGGTAQLTAAGRLVLGEVSGTTLTSIEQDGGGWEVTVAGDDGAATDASTDAEGTQITRGPTKDDDDADDLAERKREVAAADLDFEQAAAAVAKAQPGTIRELNLDTRDGSDQVVWEADVRDSSGNQVSVSIDAGTGDVVSQRSDDD